MRSTAAVLGVLAAALSLSSHASPPAAEAPPLFGERIDVSVINLEVYVTDAKGNVVHGLKREDFTLLEDGKPVEITNFSAVEGGTVATVTAESGQVETTQPTAAALPPELRLNLIVYVDNVHLQPSNRKRAFARIADFLAKAPPGSRLMVVSTDPGLHVAVPMTENVADVVAGLEAMTKKKSVGVETYVARLNAIRSIRSTYESEGCSEIAVDLMRAFSQAYAKPKHHDEAAALTQLGQFVGTLAGIPGRKVLLHVSDGIPLVAGQEVFALVAQLCGGEPLMLNNSEYSLVNPLRRLTTLANSSGVTFYTLEAAGLRNFSSSSAEFANVSLDAQLDFEDQANHQDTLFNLASETGGRAILNTNQLEIGLARVADDLANYYSLGYMPSRPPGRAGDERPRALAVRVRGEHLTARLRKTYRDKSAAERTEDRVRASLLLGTGSNPLAAQIEMGAATPVDKGADKGQFLVPLRLRLPLGRLTLLPQDDHLAGQLALQMVVRDEEGNVSPLRTVTVPVETVMTPAGAARSGAAPGATAPDPTAPPGANPSGTFVYEIKMTMRKGPHRLALGVEDVASATASYLAFDFAVPAR